MACPLPTPVLILNLFLPVARILEICELASGNGRSSVRRSPDPVRGTSMPASALGVNMIETVVKIFDFIVSV